MLTYADIRNVEIFATGEHNGDPYTEEDLDAMVEAFDDVGFAPPLKQGHGEGQRAYGWVQNLRRAGKKLLADLVDIPEAVYREIKEKGWGPVSAEIYWDFERGGKVWPRVLKAVALLGGDIPAVAGLKPVYDNLTSRGVAKAYSTEIKEVAMPTITVTLKQMETICPPCAEKMAALNFKAIKLHSNDGGKTYAFPGGMPPEAFDALCAKFAPTEGFRTRCMESGAGAEVDDPGAFCNALETACMEQGKLADRQRAKLHQEGEEDDKDKEIAQLRARIAELESMLKKKEDMMMADDVVKLQTDLAAAQAEIAKVTDERRQERIAGKVGGLKVPAFRPHIQALYEAATNGAKVVKFSETGKDAKDTAPEDVVDALVVALNKQAERLFTEFAKSGQARTEGELDNPADEADRRAKAYMREKNEKDYSVALRAVLDADSDLKEAYARA